ncbi:hypothetical protein [Cellulomonas fimi]|uniref:GCN5-related N-acetyltransferase n=1 Tax=Cellulomonas fimi (strain ATCC 484 / DSM 20113 / JCM 1341 / CCUG 24087 / LMG 16345 / NBRC 15513 / NCIMB 8980 / NCTC 7547 / NRS-133) TaxID=590998 RepID=F4H110_CELFA|nr:hypothetical protein [Cellulomonas fimi]AEE47379.1 GCN5-related N-acetyltransferase [Cellulomonas fimi ATCC 484]NNH05791.1 hypothetical protein [Cellulomonas fimi]VEH36061.1 Uncharacterised protein [Cellulomonas fimi]
MTDRATLARTVHADAWELHGRLRAGRGGGAATLPGIRVMASGLPHPQWNNGDVTDPTRVDLAAVRQWYAVAGVPWGVRVPAGAPWPHGSFLFRKHLWLGGAADVVAAPVPGLRIRSATTADLARVAALCAAAFDGDPALEAVWVAPHLDAPHVATVALAEVDAHDVATACVLRSDGLAGPAAYLAGLAVLPGAGEDVAAAVSAWLLRGAFAAGARVALAHPDTDAEADVLSGLGLTPAGALDVYVDLA